MMSFPFGPNVSIDTRTLQKGDVFFALKGEFADGHDFLQQAFDKGASAAVVCKDVLIPNSLLGKTFFIVENTLDALWAHARSHLNKMPATRVALTGSSGKTTTKELIKQALVACLCADQVFATSGNFNNHIGVPLSALLVRPEHKVAVFELGMNHFGEMAQLTRLVDPDVGLIINIGTAHAGNLGGIEGVARAKGELFENLKADAVAIVNNDDYRCVKVSEEFLGDKFSFGKSIESNLNLIESKEVGDKIQLEFSYQDEKLGCLLPMRGIHNAQNALAALSVVCVLNLDVRRAITGLQSLAPVKGRLEQKKLNNGSIIIDDTYNANPDSMRAGLGVLSNFDNSYRKIAVLGEMGELGSDALKMHHEIGELIPSLGVELLFLCGSDNALAYKQGAISQGFDPARIILAQDSQVLSTKISEMSLGNSVVFVKGSRSTKMEIVVQKILNEDLVKN